MRRTLVAVGLSIAVVATGCDAFGDDVAATVNGIDISWNQVNSLAKGFAEPGAVSRAGVTDGASARSSVNRLVFLGVVQAELKERKVEVTDADRSAARDKVSQDRNEGPFFAALDDAGKAVELDLVASQTKLSEAISALDPTSADVQRELLSRLRGLDQVKCADIVQIAGTGDADGVETKLKAGAVAADLAAADPTNVQQQRVCLTDVARSAVQGAEVLDDPPGSVTRQEGAGQDGATVVGLIRPTGSKTLEVGDPDLVQVIQRLQQQQEWPLYALKSANVDLDPRLGTWSEEQLTALAPELPLDRSPKTTLAPTDPSQVQSPQGQDSQQQPSQAQPSPGG